MRREDQLPFWRKEVEGKIPDEEKVWPDHHLDAEHSAGKWESDSKVDSSGPNTSS